MQLYKISTLVPIVLFLILVILNFVAFYFVQKNSDITVIETAKLRLSDQSNTAQYLIEFSERNALPNLMQDTLYNLTANRYITSATLLSPENIAIVSSQQILVGASLHELLNTLTPSALFSNLVTAEIQNVKKNQQSSFQVSEDKLIAIYLSAVKLGQNQNAVLMISYDLAASTTSKYKQAKFWLLQFGIILILIHIFLVYGFHKVISARTEKILGAIKLYVAGNRRLSINVSGADEIGTLASRIQELFDRVNTTEELLIAKTQELEKINTQLITAKNMAEKSNKAKSEFLANMSHEIRTPMSVILGSTEMLIDSDLNKKSRARYLNILKKSGDTLLSLINDILDVSQIEAGVLTLAKENINLGSLLKDVSELHNISADLKKLELNYKIEPNLHLDYIGDPNRIKQVLNNLITNAIKYTEKGAITVSLQSDPDSKKVGDLLVEVKDTGIGIPELFRNKIFDNFTQGDLSTTKKYGGVGLGLAISKHLVEKMGGKIHFKSTPHVGSRFFFTLKLQPDFQKTITSITVPKISPVLLPDNINSALNNKYRILIVEDTEDVRILLKALIWNSNAEITECENGQQAVEQVKKSHFDLIFMDIQMPVMDGFSALKYIREWEKLENREPHKIAALTAYAMKEDREKCLNAGFDYYMSKPVKRQELRNFVSKMQALTLKNAHRHTEFSVLN